MDTQVALYVLLVVDLRVAEAELSSTGLALDWLRRAHAGRI